jgi:hypothetical protein
MQLTALLHNVEIDPYNEVCNLLETKNTGICLSYSPLRRVKSELRHE